ncbi:MAG: 8-oxo-dGTP diphosphatase [Gammaproteobacteria bacterium]|nr:8-oxo-dGTP diphosphatase [Gammaproteobacteria bacterium]
MTQKVDQSSLGYLPKDWKPPIYATLVYVTSNNQVLLIEKLRGHGAGRVNAPGGKLEVGESMKECAIREVEEEIGIKVYELYPVAVLRFQDFSNRFALQGHVFRCHRFDGVPEETTEAIPFWCDLDNLPFSRMWEDDQFWLPYILMGQSLRGDFLFSEDKLVTWSLERYFCPELPDPVEFKFEL